MRKAIRFAVQLAGATTIANWVARVRRVEALGYDTLLVPDHMCGDSWTIFPALTAAAMVSTRLRVGTLVASNDFRNPVLLARECATLDTISAGRFELGIGAGWAVRDYRGLGIQLDAGRTRVDRLSESIALMKRLFAEREVTFEGRHYRVQRASLGLRRPLTLPILIAGTRRRILSLAARDADIVAIALPPPQPYSTRVLEDGTLESARLRVGWVRAAAGDRFNKLELSMFLDVTLTDDPECELRAMAARRHCSTATLSNCVSIVVGTLNDVRERICAMNALGFSYFCFRGPNIERLGPIVREFTSSEARGLLRDHN